MIIKKYYTGPAWKHHISDHFEANLISHDNGAGIGATIFINYDKMIEYLEEDGRKWHIAELSLSDEYLSFDYGNNYMATINKNIPSLNGFKPLS